MNSRSWGLGLLLVSVISCSSDDDPTPTDKCNSLIDQWCSKMLDCYVQNGALTAEQKPDQLSQCKQAAGQGLNCANAVGVTSNYGACQHDISAFPCSNVSTTVAPQLPTNCQGVIQLSSK